jgi:hypothetical protein
MGHANLNTDEDSAFNQEDTGILLNNRRIRTMMLTNLIKDGKPPVTNEDQKLALALMKDLDNEVLTRAKIKIASKTEQGITNLASLVGKALVSYRPSENVFVSKEKRRLPDSVKLTDAVPGEMDVGMLPLKLSDITET